eukprot:TRINITY_DN9035_c0_g1_i1.p1 TRINITY_DN9035_c0_g1~~TRINITY_DN9035_c0_g1_i1.p1  ORF type:complete len:474 (+),score=96.67 TRINITY_DN9035_c0_g1_i1:60-1481(+)
MVDTKLITPELWERSVAWAATNGLTMGRPGGKRDEYVPCPFMAVPTKFPEKLFTKVRDLEPVFNKLIDKVSRDTSFMIDQLQATADADPFTNELLKLYKEVYASSTPFQKYMLGIHRADYMINAGDRDEKDWEIGQIEINTISSAFAGLSPLVNKLHRYLNSREKLGLAEEKIPISTSCVDIPAGMNTAFQTVQNIQGKKDGLEDVLLVIQQAGERNTSDQRHLEQALYSNHGVPSIRRTLQDIAETGVLTDGDLILSGKYRCLVAYFRAGYTPNDYPEQCCWDARRLIEKSTAVKCPSVPYHLTGAKKVQQLLCDPDILSKYLTSEEVASVQTVFAQMSGLEDQPQQNEVIAAAIANPNDWVLKPQREGGGNLLHSDQMVQILKSLTPLQRGEYILMKKIRPPPSASSVVRDDQLLADTFISELGIYGLYLGDGGEPIINKAAGHLLRSKPEHQQDGGVASGVAALDSIVLV